MTLAPVLLPPAGLGSTPLMQAVDQVAADRRAGFPAALIGQAWDPASCSPAVLDWLANALSVDIWDPSWDVLRKRAAIAAAPGLHRVKGTLEGIARHLEASGASLRQAITPAARMFASPLVDKATRDAWLERMPQIRVYMVDQVGQAGPSAFAGAAVAGGLFARPDLGASLYGRRAELVDGDQVTPLRRELIDLAGDVEAERVFIPGNAAPALYAGQAFAGRAFMAAPSSPPRVVSYALRRSYVHADSPLHLDTARPGLVPLEVGYTRVSATGSAGLAQFAGQGPARRFARPDQGGALLYDRILLQDAKRDAPWVRAHSFAGHARTGSARFTATLLVDARGRLTPRAAVARSWFAGRAVAVPHDVAPLQAALAAVRVSKAFRDRVLVDAATTRFRQFGDRIPLDGSFRFGGQVTRTL